MRSGRGRALGLRLLRSGKRRGSVPPRQCPTHYGQSRYPADVRVHHQYWQFLLATCDGWKHKESQRKGAGHRHEPSPWDTGPWSSLFEGHDRRLPRTRYVRGRQRPGPQSPVGDDRLAYDSGLVSSWRSGAGARKRRRIRKGLVPDSEYGRRSSDQPDHLLALLKDLRRHHRLPT